MMMPNETTELLMRARSFVERGWCREAMARDMNQNLVEPTSEEAVAWSLLGALLAAGWPFAVFTHPVIRRVNVVVSCEPLGVFNDRQDTVDAVLAVIDRAIASSD